MSGVNQAGLLRIHRLVLYILFAASLLLTFFTGSYLWTARIGWVILALLFAIDIRFAVFAIFFYAAFFIPAGFFMSAPFTLKHFHISLFLAAAVRFVQGKIYEDLGNAIRNLHYYLPIFAIIGIAFFNFFRLGTSVEMYRIPLNFLLVLVLMIYFAGMMLSLMRDDKKLLSEGLQFLVAGTAAQAIAGFLNLYLKTSILSFGILYNNHFGILCAFILFYALALYSGQMRILPKLFHLLLTGIIFGGLVASLSRTAWFSFSLSFLIFLALTDTQLNKLPETERISLRRRVLLLMFAAVVLVLCVLNQEVFIRLTNLQQLFNWNYLKYTLEDTQNFGFLGVDRLKSLYLSRQACLTHPFFGIGFIREAVDLHGFFFSLMTTSGLIGLGLYFLFLFRILKPLERSIHRFTKPCSFLLCANFCTFVVWMLASFAETYFLQFFVWINVVLATILISVAGEN